MAEPTFFSQEWADSVRDAINTPPSEEYVAQKLFLYWDWIKAVRETFDGSLALGVVDADASERYVRLDFAKGECTNASLGDDPGDASFALAARYDDWKAIMNGYDTNKAVMYRKLMLRRGDVFRFFDRVYFFTEALASIAKVPTSFAA